MGTYNSHLSEYKEINLRQLELQAETGDLILISGSSIFSFAIKMFTATPWTHVGVIIRVDGKPYVFQSISSSNDQLKDLFQNKVKTQGVQMNSLRDTVEVDQGKVYYRKLFGKSSIDYSSEFSFINRNIEKTYERSLLELINAVSASNLYSNTTQYFCSELVAEFFYYIGFSSREEGLESNNYTPDSFSDTPTHKFKFKNEMYLGETKKVVIENSPIFSINNSNRHRTNGVIQLNYPLRSRLLQTTTTTPPATPFISQITFDKH